MMQRLAIILSLILLLVGASAAVAAPTNGGGTGSGTPPASCSSNPSLVNCQTVQNVNKNPNLNDINKIGLTLINFILYIGGAVAIIAIIIGGIRYIVSAGDPGQIASAKATIQYAIAGLLVIIFAYAIVGIIVKNF